MKHSSVYLIVALSLGACTAGKPAEDCSRTFQAQEVLLALEGAKLSARRDGSKVIGYGVYDVHANRALSDAGVGNGDLLVSICGVSAVDVFYVAEPGHQRTMCCTSANDVRHMTFQPLKGGKDIHVPLSN